MLRRLVISTLLLIPVLAYGQDIQTVQTGKSYFRASFNNEKIEKNIHKFPYWDEIQSREMDVAFEAYLTGPFARENFPEEAAMIFRFIEQGNLMGVVIEAHEKWEVLEYIKRGYSVEDISNGKAYAEYKPRAHTEARFKESRLYQFWYKQLFRGDPPAMRAFLFVHPVLHMFIRDIYGIEVTTEIMRHLIGEFGKHESIVRSEECSRKDIEKAMAFFEKTGYNYGNQKGLFLKRGLVFLREIG